MFKIYYTTSNLTPVTAIPKYVPKEFLEAGEDVDEVIVGCEAEEKYILVDTTNELIAYIIAEEFNKFRLVTRIVNLEEIPF